MVGLGAAVVAGAPVVRAAVVAGMGVVGVGVVVVFAATVVARVVAAVVIGSVEAAVEAAVEATVDAVAVVSSPLESSPHAATSIVASAPATTRVRGMPDRPRGVDMSRQRTDAPVTMPGALE
jgi:hypothetical protein